MKNRELSFDTFWTGFEYSDCEPIAFWCLQTSKRSSVPLWGGGTAGLSQSAWSLTELRWKQGSGVFPKLLPVIGFCTASQTMLRTMSLWNPSGLLSVSVTSPPGWARKEFSGRNSRQGAPTYEIALSSLQWSLNEGTLCFVAVWLHQRMGALFTHPALLLG